MSDSQELLFFDNQAEWRDWLKTCHRNKSEAWLVLFKKGAHQESLSLDEAVEEALCFGWIDGKLMKLDETRYKLRFTPRKKGSIWSVRNILRTERLIREGLMQEAGLEKVKEARERGEWNMAFERERTDTLPDDLERALCSQKGALQKYNSWTDSRKKQLNYWVMEARKPETRRRRIEAILKEIRSN